MAISLSAAETQLAFEQAAVIEHVARSLVLHAMGPSAQSILRQLPRFRASGARVDRSSFSVMVSAKAMKRGLTVRQAPFL
jgi:hypothetical protein